MALIFAGDSGKSSLHNSLRDIKWEQDKTDTLVADVEDTIVVDNVLGGRFVRLSFSVHICKMIGYKKRMLFFFFAVFSRVVREETIID